MIAATFHGTNYSPPNYDFDTIEVFPSLEEVIEALFDRYSANGKRTCPATYLDGSGSHVYYPTVEAGTYFTCYRMPEPDPDPDVTATEALEGVRLEVHTAVHGGWKDYTVTLDWSRHDDEQLVVAVEKAGI